MDALSKIAGGKDVRIENDPLAKRASYWFRDAAGEWFRVTPLDQGIQTQECEAVSARAWQCKEKVRSMFSGWGRQSDSYHVPAAGEHPAVEVERLATMEGVLAFARESGDTRAAIGELLQATDRRAFPAGAAFFPNARIPERLKPNPMLALHAAVAESIRPHGKIVGEYGAESPDRLCYAIRQTHGGYEESRMHRYMQDQGKGLVELISLQSELYLLQKTIAERVGLGKIHFLLEGISSDPVEQAKHLSILRQPSFGQAYAINVEETIDTVGDPRARHDLAMKIMATANAGDMEKAIQLLKFSESGRDYAQLQFALGALGPGHIHGLNDSDPVNTQMKATLDQIIHSYLHLGEEEQSRMIDAMLLPWYRRANERINTRMHTKSAKGETTIVVLGANHFRSGRPPTTTDVVNGMHVEDDFLAHPASKSTKLVVLEPHHFSVNKDVEHGLFGS